MSEESFSEKDITSSPNQISKMFFPVFAIIHVPNELDRECPNIACLMKMLGQLKDQLGSITIEFPWTPFHVSIELHRLTDIMVSQRFDRYRAMFAAQLLGYAEPESIFHAGDDVYVAVTVDITREPMGIDKNGFRSFVTDLEHMF